MRGVDEHACCDDRVGSVALGASRSKMRLMRCEIHGASAEADSSPRSTQRAQRMKTKMAVLFFIRPSISRRFPPGSIPFFLCVLRVLCGENELFFLSATQPRSSGSERAVARK